MKWNWGTGIAVFYTLFVLIMVFMVYKTTTYDHSLVVDDYYAKDLAYQNHYDKLENSKNSSDDLEITQNNKDQIVEFRFPKESGKIVGEILFYRPSDKSQDIVLKIFPNPDNTMIVPTSRLEKGLWKIKVDWKINDKPFYKERTLRL